MLDTGFTTVQHSFSCLRVATRNAKRGCSVTKAVAKRPKKGPGSTLTARKRKYCENYVANGGKPAQAAREAGYAAKSAKTSAWRLNQEPDVIQYINHLSAALVASYAPGAVNTIIKLSENANSEYVQLQAAQDLLDRGGLRAPDRVDVAVSGGVEIRIDLSE